MAGLKSTPFPGSPDAVIFGAVQEAQRERERNERMSRACADALRAPVTTHRFNISAAALAFDGSTRLLVFGTATEEQFVFGISDNQARALARGLNDPVPGAEPEDEAA